jgi:predicted nucleic acid-binding protein
VKVYLDICCLKRPFDDQTHPRIAVETVAVLSILRLCAGGSVEALRSSAHDLENALNSDSRRAASVATWLMTLPSPPKSNQAVTENLTRIRAGGISPFDALHLAWAQELGAGVFLTTDDRLISRANRLTAPLPFKIINPAVFVEELHR